MKDIQVSDFVKEQVQSKDYISRFSQWSTVWCGEKAYLFFMLDYNNYYIGAWSSYENIAADLQQSSGNFQDGEGAEKYLICDENGQVMVPDEEKETWLSFGENLYKDQKQDSWYYAGTISELADFYLVKEIKKQALESQLPGSWRRNCSVCCSLYITVCGVRNLPIFMDPDPYGVPSEKYGYYPER